MTITGFINRNGIRADVEWADSNPNMGDSRDMNHFRVTLRRGRKRMTVHFSQGYGISREPSARDVLECLRSDAACDEQGFRDWACDLGFDADSRSAERTYRACVRQTAQLRRFLGDDLMAELMECEED